MPVCFVIAGGHAAAESARPVFLMAPIKKAIITAAGPAQRRLPLQVLTDRNGDAKPAIAIILEEMLAAGLEFVGLIVSPADHAAYENILLPYARSVAIIEQQVLAMPEQYLWMHKRFKTRPAGEAGFYEADG